MYKIGLNVPHATQVWLVRTEAKAIRFRLSSATQLPSISRGDELVSGNIVGIKGELIELAEVFILAWVYQPPRCSSACQNSDTT